MKYLKLFGLASMLMIMMASCKNLTPFTEDLQSTNNWSEEDMKQIQFYLSEDVVIYKRDRDTESEIEDGEIRMVDDRAVEEIRIKRKTPGVLLFMPKEKRLAVGFDPNSDGKYLMFGPNPKKNGQYVLLASEWRGKRGKVQYDGEYYYTMGGASWAALLVDLKKVNKYSKTQHKAKGRKL